MLVAALLIWVPQTAIAQAPASETFEPQAVAGTAIWSTATSDIASHLSPNLSLVGHYARNPVVLQDREDSERLARLLKDQLKLDVGLGIGFFERVELGFVLPVVVYQSGESFGSFPTPNTVDLADARASIRAKILQASGFGLAAQVTGYLPTSDFAPYQSGPDAGALAALIADYQGGDAYPWRVAANIGWAFASQRSSAVLSTDDRLDFRGAAQVQVIRDTLELRASAFGRWEALAEVKNTVSAGYLGGARVFWGDTGLTSTVGLGGALAGGYGQPNLRVVASLSYAPQPEYVEVIAASGEPLDQVCSSGDDECVGSDDAMSDQDIAGLFDAENAAAVVEADDDFDASSIDSDGDGMPDLQDDCPDDPETLNGVEDEDGCPDVGESSVRLIGDRIEILERVHFDTARATIKSKSHSVLNQVASVLEAHPDILRLRVLGHTDARGDETMNLKLSQQRAVSVKEYLIKRGIDARRLSARGYGESHPIADNATEDGRQKNRRVEFHIVERSEVKDDAKNDGTEKVNQ